MDKVGKQTATVITTQIKTLKTSSPRSETTISYDEAGLTEYFELCQKYGEVPTTANLHKLSRYDLAQVLSHLRKLPNDDGDKGGKLRRGINQLAQLFNK